MSSVGGRELARLLRKGYSNDPWHGPSTSDLLRGVSAEQAAAWPVAGAHTIWELVLHMDGWHAEALRRLEGHPPGMPPQGDWPPPPPDPSEATWQEARTSLEASLFRLCDRVERTSDDELAERVGQASRPLGTGTTKAEMLIGILQHNAYHSGQVALLRKALGL